MESRAKLFGHPIHQMLIVFPLGLLATALMFDVASFALGPLFSHIAYWMIGAGVVTGLVAAPFGLIDWLAIPSGTRAKRIGAIHGAGNVVVLGLYGLSLLMRVGTPQHVPEVPALALSFLGGALAMVTGWLGGELVDRLAVGVDDGAHMNAPSSLKVRRVRV